MQVFAFGFIFTYIFLKVSIPYLLVHAPDKPNKRSSHKTVTPGSGGISFIISALIYATFAKEFIWFACLPLAIIGLIDDRFKLSASFRYLSHVLTVFLILQYTFLANYEISGLQDYLLILFLLFFGTAVINFSNFMDGIDGILAGCFFVIILFVSISFNPSFFALAGALLAFLIFNWHPARVFMGDVGSTFLGSIFLIILFSQDSLVDAAKYILVGTPIFLDAMVTVIRRFSLNENIFRAHNSHLFQRLHQANWSHSKISSLYIGSTIVIVFSSLTQNIFIVLGSAILIAQIGYFIEIKYAKPFNK